MSGNPFAEFVKDDPAESAAEPSADKHASPITSTAKPAPSSWGSVKLGEWVWAAKCPDCDNAYVFRWATSQDNAIVWDSWPATGGQTSFLCACCGSTKQPLSPRPMRTVQFWWAWFMPFPYVDLGREWRHGDAVGWDKFNGSAKTYRVQR